jgi:hypothetical protein
LHTTKNRPTDPSEAPPAERKDERRRVIGAAPLARRPSLVDGMVVLIAFFVVNVFGVITSVTVSSFATRWLGTWLPSGWTTR